MCVFLLRVPYLGQSFHDSYRRPGAAEVSFAVAALLTVNVEHFGSQSRFHSFCIHQLIIYTPD